MPHQTNNARKGPESRSERVNLRVTPSTLADWRRRADRAGLSLTDLITHTMNGEKVHFRIDI